MTSWLPIHLCNFSVSSPLALDRKENRNFELFGPLKAKRRSHWSSSLDSLHCNGWNFLIILSKALQGGIFLWSCTILKDCPGAFFIPSIKSLPTYFLFIMTPSIPSPNVWVSTHLNTWKPSCLLRRRKPAFLESEMSAHRTEENSGLLGSQWPTN